MRSLFASGAALVLFGCHGASSSGPADADTPEIDGGADAGTDATPPQPRWLGIIGTGQSLSVGAASGPVISVTPSARDLKLSLGARATTWPIDPADPALAMAPLVEPIRPIAPCCSMPYPLNIYGETFHTAMAAELDALYLASAGSHLVSAHSVLGQGAASITIIRKNGTGNAYAASLFEATAIKRLADAAGAAYEIGAVMLTHGEADATLATYEDEIVTLATNYNQDLKAITGQTRDIPLVVSQQHEAPPTGIPTSTIAAWRAGVDHPGLIYCAGPKYQYTYAGDHIHLIAEQYDRLGEKYAEVVNEVVLLGHDWQPLQPIAITVAQQAITVRFHVPFLPLVWDTSLGSPHSAAHAAWKNGRGFEVTDAGGEVTIDSVDLDPSAGDSVVITVDRPLMTTTTVPLVVGYAMTQDSFAAAGGSVLGRIGQLRDSDPLVGADATQIACNVTSGSNVVTAASPGGFAARGARDVVEDAAGAGALPPDTSILTLSSDGTTATLSSPWTGATGTASLNVHANERNYAVSFLQSAPLP